MVTADQYPYVASSTSLAAIVVPPRYREGTAKEYLARYDDPGNQPENSPVPSVASLDGRAGGGALDSPATHRRRNGRARAWPPSPGGDKSVLDIIVEIEKHGGAAVVNFSMYEDDVRLIMKQPFVATASDGSSQDVKSDSVPHPRSYGCFAQDRLLRICRKSNHAGSMQFVREWSASGHPEIARAAYLRSGYYADVVVFDPASYRDTATFEKPHQYATGVKYLFVNGKLAIDGGKYTEVSPPERCCDTRALRKSDQKRHHA